MGMRKIPTVFLRDESQRMTYNPNPLCDWVFRGEGIATVKLDGTCVMCWRGEWFFRRTVKPGKPKPEGFVELEVDPNTGNTVGWEPRVNSSFNECLIDAGADGGFVSGTYELCGPKIHRNPQELPHHSLFRHSDVASLHEFPRDWEGMRSRLEDNIYMEGVVFHHMDGRMAKVRRKDFGLPWPTHNAR
jgi:hypothetical protein